MIGLSKVIRFLIDAVVCKLNALKGNTSMTPAEQLAILAEIGTNLDEAVQELTTAVQNAGNATPEVSAKLTAIRNVSKQLKDIVSEPVEPGTPGEPTPGEPGTPGDGEGGQPTGGPI